MARLILEDVTLIKGAEVAVHVRFKGATTSSLTLPRAKASWEERQTRQEVVALIDRLLDEHTDGEAAAVLNARGLVSGTGKPFRRRQQITNNIDRFDWGQGTWPVDAAWCSERGDRAHPSTQYFAWTET